MDHLFFDLDGTLTDPAPGIIACLLHAARTLGHSVDGDMKRFIGPPLWESFREILGTDDGDRIEEAVGLYRERFSAIGLYENAVYPGIPEALVQLRDAGFSLCVVTSKPNVYADRIIDHFGLREYFSAIHGAELDGRFSEKAELLAHVLQTERTDPTRTCMIGDRKHDVVGARANGIATVGVLWGYGTRRELNEAGADCVIDAAEQLPAALRGLWSARS